MTSCVTEVSGRSAGGSFVDRTATGQEPDLAQAQGTPPDPTQIRLDISMHWFAPTTAFAGSRRTKRLVGKNTQGPTERCHRDGGQLECDPAACVYHVAGPRGN
jgi:hypothetical protein